MIAVDFRRAAGFLSIFVYLASTSIAGCLPWAGVVNGGESGSLGTASRGLLLGGEHLANRGEHFRFYRARDRRYGIRELTGLVQRVSKTLDREFPGTVLLLGDLSGQGGGFISEHHSHRSGRDVDLAFFVTSPSGKPIHGWPLTRFDRFGAGLREETVCRFDAERNWMAVEALIADEESRVQWIFVSHGLKALLLEWALNRGRDIEIIRRAASILHQPGDSAPHDDHFHVRIYCPDGAAGARCKDLGPVWPWVEKGERGKRWTTKDLMALALD